MATARATQVFTNKDNVADERSKSFADTNAKYGAMRKLGSKFCGGPTQSTFGLSRALGSSDLNALQDSARFKVPQQESSKPCLKSADANLNANAILKSTDMTQLNTRFEKVQGAEPERDKTLTVHEDNSHYELQSSSEVFVDPDASDKDNPFMVSGHVKDIMVYLHSQESDYAIPDMFLKGRKIVPSYRKQLLNWIFEVHSKTKCCQDTLFLAVYLIDRYTFLDRSLKKEEYQLVGVTGLWVAAKFEEIYPPHHLQLIPMTGNAYKPKQMLAMEKKMLKALKFQINRPSTCIFLRRASKLSSANVSHHTMAKFFCEIALLEYSLVSTPPSKIAAASLFLAFKLLEEKWEWNCTLERYTFYSADSLQSTIQLLAAAYTSLHQSTRCKNIFTKYSGPKFMSIALHPSLTSTNFKALLPS